MENANPRQQIVDSIKGKSNILVTVSTSPSVDELSAALGLTIMLNKLGKRAVALVSGNIPPAITFLEPQKTFEGTADSLRDFIIALDKEKADHLRYKVDGDVVKIFITPYRTILSEKDLDFSQGEYNVELVIALGVQDQGHLDKAMDAHGRILHDATVITISAGTDTSSLGSVNWQDEAASSLCEMLVGLSEALKEDKPLLDEQVSTAFLTGLVSATDRFSNNQTSSRVMTMAAQLMAAGANQQLIAAKLQEGHAIGATVPAVPRFDAAPSQNDDGTISLNDGGDSAKVAKSKKPKKAKSSEGGLSIEHSEPTETKEPEIVPALAPAEEPEIIAQPAAEEPKAKLVAEEEATAEADAEPTEQSEEELARELEQLVPSAPIAAPSEEDIAKELAQTAPEATPPPVTEPAPVSPPPMEETAKTPPAEPSLDFNSLLPPTPSLPLPPPGFGQPLPPLPPPIEDLTPPPAPPSPPPAVIAPVADITSSHTTGGYIDGNQQTTSPINGTAQVDPEVATVDPFATPLATSTLPTIQPDPLFEAQQQADAAAQKSFLPATEPATSSDSDLSFEETPIRSDEAAVAAVPDFAALNPTGLASPPTAEAPKVDAAPLPPMPDFSSLPPLPPQGFDTAPVPAPAPLAPATPEQKSQEELGAMFAPAPAAPAASPPASSNLPPAGQFKIPGQ